jgi:hypothetical protein
MRARVDLLTRLRNKKSEPIAPSKEVTRSRNSFSSISSSRKRYDQDFEEGLLDLNCDVPTCLGIGPGSPLAWVCGNNAPIANANDGFGHSHYGASNGHGHGHGVSQGHLHMPLPPLRDPTITPGEKPFGPYSNPIRPPINSYDDDGFSFSRQQSASRHGHGQGHGRFLGDRCGDDHDHDRALEDESELTDNEKTPGGIVGSGSGSGSGSGGGGIGESRIVAPNVEKLSPGSVVEVRLSSSNETVAVLCSVDVLKMQSEFFHDVLVELDKNFASLGPDSWREPITLPEQEPFNAAAFLESLHEGRHMYRNEWSMCWARLAVTWCIKDLVATYGRLIEEHVRLVLDSIDQEHWRVNPSRLAGMSVAVFRKGPTTLPTVLMGRVLDQGQYTQSYSRIRVVFDEDQRAYGTQGKVNISSMLANPQFQTAAQLESIGGNHLSVFSPVPSKTPVGIKESTIPPFTPSQDKGSGQGKQVVGDVVEPFWVRDGEGSWKEPDEIFESCKVVSVEDQQIFWEMAQSIIELDQLAASVPSTLRSIDDLVSILTRQEYRILWSDCDKNGPSCLPKDTAVLLLNHAYSRDQDERDRA